MVALWTTSDIITAAKLNKSFNSGLDADKGTPSVIGEAYLATDTNKLYYSLDGTTWGHVIETIAGTATHAALTNTHGGDLQTAAMKNVASGIAGLDASALVPLLQIPYRLPRGLIGTFAWADMTVVQGTWTSLDAASQTDYDDLLVSSAALRFNSSNANLNEFKVPDLVLNAGAYEIKLTIRKQSNAGIIEVLHGAASIGTYDSYAAASVHNTVITFTYSPTARTNADLRLRINGKNASSTGYYLLVSRIQIHKITATVEIATHAALTASHGQATIEGIAGSQAKVDTHAALTDTHGGVLQTAAMKNVASGIAGLDVNILLNPAQMYPIVEEYANHLGIIDNFSQTGVTGNGAATSNATNHRMDLSTGITAVGGAKYETKKTWALHATRPIVLNFVVQNIVVGAGGERLTFIGMMVNFLDTVSYSVVFLETTDDSWQTYTCDAASYTMTAITALAAGDLITIVATTAKVLFYVNGTLVATHTTTIPTDALKVGGCVITTNTAATTARQLGVDLIDLKVYK